MSIQIYNTLSKRKEEFKPLEPGKVKMEWGLSMEQQTSF